MNPMYVHRIIHVASLFWLFSPFIRDTYHQLIMFCFPYLTFVLKFTKGRNLVIFSAFSLLRDYSDLLHWNTLVKCISNSKQCVLLCLLFLLFFLGIMLIFLLRMLMLHPTWLSNEMVGIKMITT